MANLVTLDDTLSTTPNSNNVSAYEMVYQRYLAALLQKYPELEAQK